MRPYYLDQESCGSLLGPQPHVPDMHRRLSSPQKFPLFVLGTRRQLRMARRKRLLWPRCPLHPETCILLLGPGIPAEVLARTFVVHPRYFAGASLTDLFEDGQTTSFARNPRCFMITTKAARGRITEQAGSRPPASPQLNLLLSSCTSCFTIYMSDVRLESKRGAIGRKSHIELLSTLLPWTGKTTCRRRRPPDAANVVTIKVKGGITEHLEPLFWWQQRNRLSLSLPEGSPLELPCGGRRIQTNKRMLGPHSLQAHGEGGSSRLRSKRRS